MSDVFISYKRENLAAVGRLVEALRAESVDVWWDQDIPPNAPWEATIEQELAAARLVIVAWSPVSVASDNVKAEARWARTQGRLLQVFVEGCEPPLFFGERQGVDLKGWSGGATDPAFLNLLQAVRMGLTSAVHPAPVTSPTSAPAPALPTKPSIAVMPFANLSGDPEQEYFADGMVEEIATALSRCRSLFVIGAGSGLSFKGKGATPQEAARILGVRYVLEGSVRKAAGRVRIAVKLTDAVDGGQVWADRFEDTLEDVFALQDKVALNVAGVIEPAVREADVRRAIARPTENIGSYDLALRAMARYRSWGKDDVLAGLEMLNRAIAMDPHYGLALAMAALCHGYIVLYSWSDDPVGHLREAKALTERALAVAADDADVLATLVTGVSLFAGMQEGAALADRAKALNPGSSLAWLTCGAMSVLAGAPQLGMEQLQRSLRLDPRSQWEADLVGWLGVAHVAQSRFQEAVPLLRQSIQLRPHWGLARGFLAATLGQLGDLGGARATLDEGRGLAPIDLSNMSARWPDPVLRKIFDDGLAKALDGSGPSAARRP
jgi:adenylate cyclase